MPIHFCDVGQTPCVSLLLGEVEDVSGRGIHLMKRKKFDACRKKRGPTDFSGNREVLARVSFHCRMYSVFACGSNSCGQLGLGHDEDVFESKLCFRSKEKPINIACGSNHTLILLENGDVYVSGANTSRLLNVRHDVSQFTKLDGTYKCIGAGWTMFVLVKSDNSVIVYDNDAVQEIAAPTNNMVNLYTSLNSVIIQYESGELVCYGDNSKGQLLGLVDSNKAKNKNIEVTKLEFSTGSNRLFESILVLDIAMGRDYTLFRLHNNCDGEEYILMRSKTDRRNILSQLNMNFGFKDGTLGTHLMSRWFKVDKSQYRIKALKSMWSSVHVVYEKDHKLLIKSFGNNVYGQLFTDITDSKERLINDIDEVKTGTEHGIVVLKNRREVYAWGWGEHGNCGAPLIESPKKDGIENSVKGLIYSTETGLVEKVYGGYAVSWVVVHDE